MRSNEALLVDVQQSGEMFISNTIVNGKDVLGACVVNFRTTVPDINTIVETSAASASRSMHGLPPPQKKRSVPSGSRAWALLP